MLVSRPCMWFLFKKRPRETKWLNHTVPSTTRKTVAQLHMEVWLVSKGKIRNIIYDWCQLGMVYIRLEEQGSEVFVLRVNVVFSNRVCCITGYNVPPSLTV